MVTENALILVQARMRSQRLPGKVMKKIAGRPMIGILFDRLRQSGLDILLATSLLSADDPLAEFARAERIDVFRGDETNVLQRFYLATKERHRDVLVRVTGDNPLTDGQAIHDNVAKYRGLNNPRCYYSSGGPKGMPLGTAFEIFSRELLDEAYRNATQPGELEHVTPYMHQNRPGDIAITRVDTWGSASQYRLTVDTEEDFSLINQLVTRFGCDKKSVDEIVAILNENPRLAQLNKGVAQRQWNQ